MLVASSKQWMQYRRLSMGHGCFLDKIIKWSREGLKKFRSYFGGKGRWEWRWDQERSRLEDLINNDIRIWEVMKWILHLSHVSAAVFYLWYIISEHALMTDDPMEIDPDRSWSIKASKRTSCPVCCACLACSLPACLPHQRSFLPPPTGLNYIQSLPLHSITNLSKPNQSNPLYSIPFNWQTSPSTDHII
jgi:hypothetical protein